MTASIRQATMNDKAAVERLWLALHTEQHEMDPRYELAADAVTRWRNDFRGWVRSAGRWMWVAEVDGAAVGFATAERHFLPPIYRDAAELYVSELFVSQASRRMGIGRQLVERVLDVAAREAVESVRLSMLAANDRGRAFWRAVGAEPFAETLLLSVAASPPEKKARRRLGF